MWKSQYIVVGDIFRGFADSNSEVLTRTDLFTKLSETLVDRELVCLHVGQGINVSDVESMIKHSGIRRDIFKIENRSDMPKALMRNTHKHREQNVLVSVARKISGSEYEMRLIINGANELLGDHVTGQHVQGMAIVEATRQAFLSVTEQYYIKGSEEEYYFVINSMNVEYEAFLFPIETTLRYTVVEESSRNGRLKFTVEVELFQAACRCAKSTIRFAAFERSLIAKKEESRARTIIESILFQTESEPSVDSAA